MGAGQSSPDKGVSMATAAFSELVAKSGADAFSVADRIKGCLFGLLIADALSMPTHWFYGGERQVVGTYGGRLNGYVKPTSKLPGSIMSLSNTGGAGRGTRQWPPRVRREQSVPAQGLLPML